MQNHKPKRDLKHPGIKEKKCFILHERLLILSRALFPGSEATHWKTRCAKHGGSLPSLRVPWEARHLAQNTSHTWLHYWTLDSKTWYRDPHYLFEARICLQPTPCNEPRNPGVRSALSSTKQHYLVCFEKRCALSSRQTKSPVGTAYLKHSIVGVAGTPGWGEETWGLVPALLPPCCGSLGCACDLTWTSVSSSIKRG